MPWYVTVPSALAVLVAAGFAVLASWIEWNGPVVGARWRVAVEREVMRRPVREEVTR